MLRQLQPWITLLVLPLVLLLCYVITSLTQGLDSEGRQTYEFAGYSYPNYAKFDNTWLTWSTDYLISLILLINILFIKSIKTENYNKTLQDLIILLLSLYGLSTLVGGLAHQLYSGDTSELNSYLFYIMWVVVVGCTAVAGGVQGRLGNLVLS